MLPAGAPPEEKTKAAIRNLLEMPRKIIFALLIAAQSALGADQTDPSSVSIVPLGETPGESVELPFPAPSTPVAVALPNRIARSLHASAT